MSIFNKHVHLAYKENVYSRTFIPQNRNISLAACLVFLIFNAQTIMFGILNTKLFDFC